MRVHEVNVHPALPERLGWLGEIARNVWTSWNPEAQELFARLDPEGWEAVEQNPVALLRRLPQEQLDAAAADESFVAMVARVARRLDAYANDEGWFPGAHPDAAGMRVAYFSLEFGLDAGIPLYSGGLGILAGDHLKSASDLGVPLVGVGLLYRSGYFRQSLGPDGGQRERYPATDWGDLPLADQPGPDGRPVTVEVEIGGEAVRAAVRRIQVGRVPLLLLDCDVEGNSPEARDITGVLYGGDRELRIRQEILLGVGGVRALAAAGIAPTVFHMNEGHSALLALERIRAMIDDGGMGAAEARERVLASTVFTTHTPVPAGNEAFEPELARAYLEPLAEGAGMDWEALAAARVPARRGGLVRPHAARPAHLGLRERGRGAPRRHVAAHVARALAGAAGRRGAHRQHHQRHPHRELAQPRDAGAARPLRRPRPARAAGGPGRVGARRRHPRRGAVARARAAARAPGAVRARAPARPVGAAGLAPPRQPGGRRRAPPRRPDHLLRAPVRHLQAGEPPLPRPRAARPAARRREAARAADRRRQGAPGRRARKGRAARCGARVAAPPAARPHRLPRGLRHARRPLPRAGRRRVAERAAPPARGLGHQRHEGGRQRRPEPVGARRVVGRGLLAGRRVGHRIGGAVRGSRGERRRRGRGALHAARARGDPAVLPARLLRAPPRVDGDDDGLDPPPGGRLQHRPHGPRLRRARLPARPPRGRRPGRRRRGGRARARRLARADAGLVARGERAQQRARGGAGAGGVRGRRRGAGHAGRPVRSTTSASRSSRGSRTARGASRRAPWCRRPTAARPGASTGSWPRCRRPRAAAWRWPRGSCRCAPTAAGPTRPS